MRLLTSVVFALFCTQSFASDLGVRAQSFGTAFRAVATSNEIIFTNPAGILKTRRIGIDGDYQLNIFNQSNRLTVSLVDSKTTSWGMGLAYSADFMTGAKSTHTTYVSMAMPLGTDMIALGGSFSYVYNPRFDDYRHFFNMDLALMVNLPIGLSFVAALDHLVGSKGQEKPLGFALATALDFGKNVPNLPLTLSFDWSMNDVKSDSDLRHTIAAGGEFMVLSFIPIRAGYKHQKDHHLSLGTGILLPVVAIDAVYQQNLSTPSERHIGLAVRLSL